MPLYRSAPSDLSAIADLINAAYRGREGAQGWTHEADYIDGLRTWPEALAADLAAEPGAVLLVLRETEGEPVQGCVWLHPLGEGVWYLGLLSIRPELQDRRLGRAVMQEAEAWAMARGARRMRMVVVNVRDTLIGWYERQGYVLTGEKRPFPYDDQRFGRPRRDDLEFVVLEKAL
jgi:ribosomal protein S18 acetylase RimI-like enzyme